MSLDRAQDAASQEWDMPTSAPTVTTVLSDRGSDAILADSACWHVTVVLEVQLELKQVASPTNPVEVCSPTPKLRPLTVTDPYPLCGAFRFASDAAGESKLNTACPVRVAEDVHRACTLPLAVVHQPWLSDEVACQPLQCCYIKFCRLLHPATNFFSSKLAVKIGRAHV